MKQTHSMLLAICLAIVVAVPAQAHYSETPHDHPNLPDLTIAAPVENTTVSTIFTIRGTANPNCTLQSLVTAQDNQNGGPIESVPQRSGSNFSYTVNTARVLTREGLDPYTLRSGRIAVSIYIDFDDPDCESTEANLGYKEIFLTLQHPGTPPPPQAVKKQLEVPDIKPSPTASPSPSLLLTPAPAAAIVNAKVFGLESWLAILLATLLGGLVTGLAEYSAIRYRRKHPKK